MQRLVLLIALVFSIASLAGMTTAHAHRYISTPIVVLNHVDADNVAIPVIVQIQRGEIDLGSGIFLPCGPHNAIATLAPVLPGAPEGDAPLAVLQARLTPWLGDRLLRPPRPA
tara:strand:- start:1133 stop:1471 length:339 start_codon:yes stop_codon:yes gene_type:complete